MKIRNPSVIGSAVWAVFFLVVLITIFAVGLIASWHLIAGMGLFIVAVFILALGNKLVLGTVGYVDTEFALGLLFGTALALAAMAAIGKFHKSSLIESRTPHAHSKAGAGA